MRGSTTIEATIVFPVVFLCIIGFIYLCITMYQQVVLQAMANEVAISIQDEDLEQLNQRLQKQGVNMKVDIQNRFIYKEANITLSRDYPIRVGNLLKPLGFSENYHMQANSKAVLKNQVSFIRNMDFVTETLKDTEYLTGGKISKFLERINVLIRFFSG